jgi:hypothetical protein
MLGRKYMRESAFKHPAKSTQSNGVRPTRLLKPKARARVTNGRSLLAGADGRYYWCRRLRDLIALHTQDAGGDANISEGERSLIRRIACLEVEVEGLEQQFARNGASEPWQLELYSRTANTLRRLFQTIGLQRRTRDITNGVTLGEAIRADQLAERQRLARKRRQDDDDIVTEAAE